MSQCSQADDPSLRDHLWVGYHPCAMAPLIFVVAFISLLVWTGQWYLDDISALAVQLGGWATFAIAWGVWPAVLVVFLYRCVTFTYRITDQAVFVDLGPLYHPIAPLRLETLDLIVIGGGWLARQLGVGCVDLRAGNRVLRLKGIWHPKSFVAKLQAAKDASRQTA